MSDIDTEPRNRSATGAVIIAVIFLAVLGTGVGIVLGTQAKNREPGDNVANNSTATASPSPSVTVTQTTDPGNDNGGDGTATRTRNPTNTKTYRPITKTDCPEQTDEAAGTSLSVKLYIKTNRSEVWICEGGGRTVYQGHVLGTQFTAATSSSTLFISSVRYEAGVYSATNGDTVYYVSPERLRIEKNRNEISNEPAVDTYSG
jgi:hypothetical protein